MNDDQRSSQLASLRIERPTESPGGEDEPPARWPLVLAGAAVATLVVGVGAWLLWGRGDRAPAAAVANADAAPPPAAASSGPGDLVSSGYVVARRRATVAAEITGRVAEVLVEEGMIVKKGQLLARLVDHAGLDRLRDLPSSRVESASASLAATRVPSSPTSKAHLQEADAGAGGRPPGQRGGRDQGRHAPRRTIFARNWTRAEGRRLTAARSDAKHAFEVLGKHRIVAPFDGVVTDKNAQPGEIISPMSAGGGFTRTGICTLVDMDSLEIEVDVNEAYISRVKAEQSVTATLDAYPDWAIPARVIAIVPTANREKATVRVRIALLSKDPRILPDMAVKVSMSSARSS